MTKGVVFMPLHCSDGLGYAKIESYEAKQKDSSDSSRKQRQIVLVALQCHKSGVAWRGLCPLLFESPSRVANKALRILTRRFSSGGIRIQNSQSFEDTVDILSRTHYCRSRMSLKGCNLLYIVPPDRVEVDYDFSGRLIHYEHIWLQMQTLSAYYATLGGGYFLCRRLSTAIWLARQQRQIATWMGDYAMADRCTLNESYNYLHAGHFDVAFAMLKTLKASARARNDVVLFNMCKSARLLGKRMKRAGKRGTDAESNVDDYQRIRIVGKL